MYLLWLLLAGGVVGLLVNTANQWDMTGWPVWRCLGPLPGFRGAYACTLVCALAAGWILAVYPPSPHLLSSAVSQTSILAYVGHLLLVVSLVAIAADGFTEGSVPTGIAHIGIAVGCLFALLVPHFGGMLHLRGLPENISSFGSSVAGAALGYGVLYLLDRAYGGKGPGIPPLAGFLGAFLGLDKLLACLALSCIIGAILSIGRVLAAARWTSVAEEYGRELQFSGMLAVGGIVAYFWGDAILRAVAH